MNVGDEVEGWWLGMRVGLADSHGPCIVYIICHLRLSRTTRQDLSVSARPARFGKSVALVSMSVMHS